MIISSETLLYLISAVSETSATAEGTLPVTEPSDFARQVNYVMTGLGVILLAIWLIRIFSRKRKLSLTDAPGRANTLSPPIILVIYVFAMLVAGVTAAFLTGKVAEHFDIVIGHIVGQAGGITLAVFIARWCFNLGPIRGMGLCARHWIYDSLRAVFAYIAVYPLCLVTLYFSKFAIRYFFDYETGIHVMLEILRQAGVAGKIVVIFSTTILTPIYEEIFFRGMLQSLLRKYTGPWRAVLISSVIFGAAHYGNPESIPPLIIFGIALGYNYERTGRLWASILLHAIFNMVSIITILS